MQVHPWDRELDRSVALKLLREDVSLDPVGRERFHRELEATTTLSHPNLETVILKALEKAPERRQADAGVLAEELKRFL